MFKQISNICFKAISINFNVYGASPLYSSLVKFNFAEKK